MDVGHELFRPGGVVSWPHAGTGECWGRSCAGKLTSYDRVLHQVRAPLPTISSSCTEHPLARDYIRGNVSREMPDTPSDITIRPGDPVYTPDRILFSMLSYVVWHRKIMDEWEPEGRFRVEDLVDRQSWLKFAVLVRLPQTKWGQPPEEPGNTATRKEFYGKELTWEQLDEVDRGAADEVRELALEFGYGVG
jgi:hypothetical protein